MEGIEQIEAVHADRVKNSCGMDEEAYLIAMCDLNLKQEILDVLRQIAKNQFENRVVLKPGY